LSIKLFDWTKQRWIITFSKVKGDLSIKEKEIKQRIISVEKGKKSDLYKSMQDYFSDAKLIEVTPRNRNDK